MFAEGFYTLAIAGNFLLHRASAKSQGEQVDDSLLQQVRRVLAEHGTKDIFIDAEYGLRDALLIQNAGQLTVPPLFVI